jgi:hypothetical protein
MKVIQATMAEYARKRLIDHPDLTDLELKELIYKKYHGELGWDVQVAIVTARSKQAMQLRMNV